MAEFRIKWKRVSLDEPAAEPVGFEEVSARLVVATAEDQEEITRQIRSARELIEHRTERQLMPATWRGVADGFPAGDGEILIDDGLPFRSVSSIQYLDAAGVLQTLDAAEYQADAVREPGRIKPAVGSAWPATQTGAYGAVIVTTTNGYVDGDGNPDVPQVAKDAIIMLIGKWRDRLGLPGSVDESWREEFERMIAPLLWN